MPYRKLPITDATFECHAEAASIVRSMWLPTNWRSARFTKGRS
ncbi:MAG: hypothetical protein R3C99_07585 [Pirellulaceae bacterium]